MQTRGNINFILVGARATGKTVYLASLYLNEKSVTAQDERTIEYLKPLSEILLEGEYPSATSGNLHELMFNYKDEKFSSSIQIDDVDGHFIETLSQKDETTQDDRDKLIQNMKLSEGIIFFFPYQELFNEKSIREFNYQIDTVISKLKEMYADRSSIPIPVVIAVAKWDDSPHYQKENEDEKALSYIENHQFLRLAKEKIEVNFTSLKIIPLSAIGKNINELKPYNLKKPIEFFLEETYRNWVERINELEDDKEALLSFLFKINFDMKTYDDGKYDKLYKQLESEYATKMLKEVGAFKNLKEYVLFEETNKKTIGSLLAKNRDKLLKRKLKLSQTQTVKRFSGFSLVASFVGVSLFAVLAWNANKLLIKSETELFTDISTEYNSGNYEDAQEDIEDYLSAYKDTVNLEHKQKILAFKSHVDTTLQKRDEDRKIAELLAEAQTIIVDKSYEELERIDEVFTSMNELGIDNIELKSKLLEAKERLSIKKSYRRFKESLEEKNFDEALLMVEVDWKDSFGEENKVLICKILDKALNLKVETLMDEISGISDVDEFNALVKIVNTIEDLKNNTIIKKISYKASLNSENENRFSDKLKVYEHYSNILNNGIIPIYVAFGAEKEENEPLGFNCTSESQIILKIETKTYNFDNKDDCKDIKISWRNPQQFENARYNVKVLEEDLLDNDEYITSFILSNNDLIKLENKEIVTKDIGKSYYIEIGNEE